MSKPLVMYTYDWTTKGLGETINVLLEPGVANGTSATNSFAILDVDRTRQEYR